jgi:hypothetical protein
MSDVSTMQPYTSTDPGSAMVQPQPTEAEPTASEVESATEEPTNGTSKRRKRKFRPDEIALAHQFKELAEPGTKIPFSSLTIDMKRSVLPQRNVRLVDRGLVDVDYDEETGTIESVSINPEIWRAFADDLVPVVVPSPVYERRRRAKFPATDEKYKLVKLVSANPRREGSHAWYNWEECYRDGFTVPQYLGFMDYNRMIITSNGTYFNGPAILFLNQDIKSGYVGVYDSTLPLNDDGTINQEAFLKPEDLDAIEDTRTPESES